MMMEKAIPLASRFRLTYEVTRFDLGRTSNMSKSLVVLFGLDVASIGESFKP